MAASAGPTSGSNATSSAGVLADIATRLAGGGEIVAKVTDIIERVRLAHDAEECALNGRRRPPLASCRRRDDGNDERRRPKDTETHADILRPITARPRHAGA